MNLPDAVQVDDRGAGSRPCTVLTEGSFTTVLLSHLVEPRRDTRAHHQPLPLPFLLQQLCLVLAFSVERPPLGDLGEHHHQGPDLIEPERLIHLVFGVLVHVRRRWTRPVEKVGFGEVWLLSITREDETLKVHMEGSDLRHNNSA